MEDQYLKKDIHPIVVNGQNLLNRFNYLTEGMDDWKNPICVAFPQNISMSTTSLFTLQVQSSRL